MSYSERFAKWRERLGLSREDVAVVLRCSARTIEYRETEPKWSPKYEDLVKLDEKWPGSLDEITGSGSDEGAA